MYATINHIIIHIDFSIFAIIFSYLFRFSRPIASHAFYRIVIVIFEFGFFIPTILCFDIINSLRSSVLYINVTDNVLSVFIRSYLYILRQLTIFK